MPIKDLHNEHKSLKALVTPYCFGDATDSERMALEMHLLECEVCWNEVQRLDAAIQTMRTDRGLFKKLVTSSTIGFFGLSGAVSRPFGGHLWHVLLSCFLYSFLYAISLVFEVIPANEPRASTWAGAFAIVLPWIFASAIAGLFLDWRLTRQGKASGLLCAMSIFTVGTLLLLLGTWFFFPAQPANNIDSHGYPPQIAYIKDVIYYYLPFALAFLVLPFHFVIALQEDLRNGRHRATFALLSGDRGGVTPRGAMFPKVWLLSALLALMGLLFVVLTNTLFDRLNRGAHTTLFMFLIQLKNFVYFTLGVECLMWYSRSLDELKRECVAVLREMGSSIF